LCRRDDPESGHDAVVLNHDPDARTNADTVSKLHG
jgi:hypothetical protein